MGAPVIKLALKPNLRLRLTVGLVISHHSDPNSLSNGTQLSLLRLKAYTEISVRWEPPIIKVA